MTTTAVTAVAADEITTETVGQFSIAFASENCIRCGGTGRTSFTWVQGGACFGCGTTGRRATRAGATARKVYEELADELFNVPVENIVEGDVVWLGGRWRRVESVRRTPGGEAIVQGKPHTFADSIYITPKTGKTDYGYQLDRPFKVRRYNAEAVVTIMRRMVATPGATVSRKPTA